MTLLDIIATLLVLSALFGMFNHVWLGLPHTVGLVVMGLAASLAIVAIDWAVPGLGFEAAARPVLASIDFRTVLLDGFLSALLFAGALHVDFSVVMEQRWPVVILATVGVLISTAVVGFSIWAIAPLCGIQLPLIWALTFGALISPTDPVAVLSMLKTIKIPAPLEAKLAAESLFNDGVGVVLFIILAAAATSQGAPITLLDAARLFVIEALGGGLLGLVAGWIAYRLIAQFDEHNIEVMITLALVAATYAVALHVGVSGPIAVVVAGVLIGHHGAKYAMSETTRAALFQFWDFIDELLNSVLFLLIGLEVLLIGRSFDAVGLAVAAIPIVMLARFLSVGIPIALLSYWTTFSRGAIPILSWAGLRGGIAIALALSVPDGPYKPALLTAAYVVVVFTILVQGPTMPRLVHHYYPPGSV